LAAYLQVSALLHHSSTFLDIPEETKESEEGNEKQDTKQITAF
jgi:hypothetical protein